MPLQVLPERHAHPEYAEQPVLEGLGGGEGGGQRVGVPGGRQQPSGGGQRQVRVGGPAERLQE